MSGNLFLCSTGNFAFPIEQKTLRRGTHRGGHEKMSELDKVCEKIHKIGMRRELDGEKEIIAQIFQ